MFELHCLPSSLPSLILGFPRFNPLRYPQGMVIWMEKSLNASRSPCGGLFSLPEHPYGHSPWMPSYQVTPCTHHRFLSQLLPSPEGGAEKGWRRWTSSRQEGLHWELSQPSLYMFFAWCTDVAGVTKGLPHSYLSGVLPSAFFSVGDIVSLSRDYRHMMPVFVLPPHVPENLYRHCKIITWCFQKKFKAEITRATRACPRLCSSSVGPCPPWP